MGGVLLCEVLSWGCFSLGFFSGRSLEAWCSLFLASCSVFAAGSGMDGWVMGSGVSLSVGSWALFLLLSFLLSLPLTPSLSSIYLASGWFWLFRWEGLYEETKVPTNSVGLVYIAIHHISPDM